MKTIVPLLVLFALLVAAPFATMAQTTFFSDNFTGGSTINSGTPTAPTATAASYETISSSTWSPPGSVTAHDLRFGIPDAGGGNIAEIQALFATNAVALTEPGDYIQLTVVFTNFAGIFCAGTPITAVSFGLYDSGQVLPLAGGLNGTEGDGSTASGGAQGWKGYVAEVSTSSSSPHYRLMTRPVQTGTANNNQDLVTQGSSTKSYSGGSTLASGTPLAIASTNEVYTDVLTITLNGTGILGITNNLYSGSDASGTLLTQVGSVASGSTFLTGGFDGLAMGFYKKADTSDSNVLDIASITVSGSVTVISTPPTITLQPVPVTVPTNGSCAFFVNANGFNTTYQWHRNGTNLDDGGNISIVSAADGSSSLLVISPAGTNDVLSDTNGYYVTVSGAGGYSTNSVTNSLTLVPATNLIWNDIVNTTWDLNRTANWQDTNGNPAVFNFGDPVTFDDTGFGGPVSLSGGYLSAASVTVNSTYAYNFPASGSGSFAGPGYLLYEGSGQLTLGNVNTYSGGTIISNASAHLLLQNYNGLGTGPVTLVSGDPMKGLELAQAGSSSSGVNGDIVVAGDFTIQVDASGSYAAVFLGNFSGTAGKTLTLVPTSVNTVTNDRIRVYGDNTVFDANLALNSPLLTFAPYNSGGSQTYNGVISGAGGVEQKGSLTYFNGANTYQGGLSLSQGSVGFGVSTVGSPGAITSGPLGTGSLILFDDSTSAHPSSKATVLATGDARTIANAIEYPSSTNDMTLIIGGSNALTFTGDITLNGDDAYYPPYYTTRTFQADNTALTTFSGVISDQTNGVSAGYGLTKTGSGVLALTNTDTYTGPTTVSAGTLQVNGQLDAASAVTVSSWATLSGSGTINGPVTVNQGGALAPGAAPISTLTLNGGLTLSGSLKVRVFRGSVGSPPPIISDQAIVSGALTNAGVGIVTVTNLGAALQEGDTFFLFNKALTNGAAMTVTGAGVSWQNNLAVDGTITVQSVTTVPTTSAHVTDFRLVNGNAVIDATNGEAGGTYYLLESTNVTTPLSQWQAVATNVVSTNGVSGAFQFIGTNVVGSGNGQQFYILSNTNN
jgi:fibronectin-binding autotransporter adhesin